MHAYAYAYVYASVDIRTMIFTKMSAYVHA